MHGKVDPCTLRGQLPTLLMMSKEDPRGASYSGDLIFSKYSKYTGIMESYYGRKGEIRTNTLEYNTKSGLVISQVWSFE